MGLYVSEATVNDATGSIQVRLMSSFPKFGANGSNTSLFEGLPELLPDCIIPARLVSSYLDCGVSNRARPNLFAINVAPSTVIWP